jgi:hypothetical protein
MHDFEDFAEKDLDDSCEPARIQIWIDLHFQRPAPEGVP